ncbi:MAG: GDP-mannose 4,6-dehydratase [Actinomycetota bacterium]
MRYFVTGGAGFIGSHLSGALLARGDSVLALDNLATGDVRNLGAIRSLPDFRFVLGSILDDELVDELMRDCDVVVHLAAAVGVRLIVDQPLRSMRTNIRGTEIVLEAAHRHRRKVLVASTSEVYGKTTDTMHELADRILGPTVVERWAYSAAKALDEHMAFAYWREENLPTVIARFFNTVGPRQSGAYGGVLPRLVAQALLGRDLTIYGDGTQTRCFCDVEDVVRALVGLLDSDQAVGEAFNVGSEEEISVAGLADRVLDATGSASTMRSVPFEQVYGPTFEDIVRRVPDTRKIRKLLGWAPAHDIDSIIKRTIGYAHEVGPENLLAE